MEPSQARVHLFTIIRDSPNAQTLEAAAKGIPIVAMDACPSRAYIHRLGSRSSIPAPENRSVRFSEAIVETLYGQLVRRRPRVGHPGVSPARNTIDSETENLLSVYEDLISNG